MTTTLRPRWIEPVRLSVKVGMLLCALIGLSDEALTQSADLSGTYVLSSLTQSDSSGTRLPTKMQVRKTTLRIVQDQALLQMAYTSEYGTTSIRKYTLDGKASENVDLAGVVSVDRIEAKGKIVVIHSDVKVTSGSLKGTPVHKTEKWELAADLKTLTMREQSEVQGMRMIDDLLTAVYIRQ